MAVAATLLSAGCVIHRDTGESRLDWEVRPAASVECFPGAIYRKAVSSTDRWTGIEGIVVLPEMDFDESRPHPRRPGRWADNPSIYMGCRIGGQEVDAGVSWEVIREADGSVSTQAKAFRPFWRVDQWGSGPARPEFYYWPGDTLRMAVRIAAEDRLELVVELLERGPAARAAGAVPAPTLFVQEFDAPGFGFLEVQEFKRVNAIDQAANEGMPAQSTRTAVTGAEWLEVWLRRRDGEFRPFVPARFTDMRCPDPASVVVRETAMAEFGGEAIDLGGRP